MQDELLAECLDELLRARRDGLSLDPDRIRARFPAGGADPRLIDFFVRLCECADDWRGPPPDATQTSDADTPPIEGPTPVPGVAPMTLGRYHILERVAAGGMGTVYKAFDPTLGRMVALKVPHIDPDHPRFEELAEQFVQEARLAAAVDHPNVCAVYDAGRHEGTPFVVMAFVEGTTLSARLKAHQRFDDPAGAADLVRRVAEGLHAAHQRKIVHRDIKPGNILLRSSDGQPILTDFGLARVAQEGAFVTRPGVIAGTVAYMAPEQAAGDAARIGPATDVYGLGVVLYQMVTERLPFDGDVPAMLARIQRADAPAPSQVRPDLDPALDAIICRAMARDPADRYRDAGELATALRAIRAIADATPTASYRQAPAAGGPRRTRTRVRIASLVLLLTAGAGLGWHAFFRTTAANGPVVPPLEGDLVVRVWTDPKAVEPNPRPKLGVAVDDKSREALPVRNIDMVFLEARLTRPAYAYVLWFPGEGGPPQPLYPWDPHPTQGFRSSPEQLKVAEVHSPARADGGWRVKGPSGLETAVLLARDTPLGPAELADLEAELGTLPAAPLGADLRECAWLWREKDRPDGWVNRGTLRGLDTSESRDRVDDPVFALLKRVQPKFDLVKAVRFAHVGDDLGAKPKPARSGGNP